jgi:hypothetical protein
VLIVHASKWPEDGFPSAVFFTQRILKELRLARVLFENNRLLRIFLLRQENVQNQKDLIFFFAKMKIFSYSAGCNENDSIIH